MRTLVVKVRLNPKDGGLSKAGSCAPCCVPPRQPARSGLRPRRSRVAAHGGAPRGRQEQARTAGLRLTLPSQARAKGRAGSEQPSAGAAWGRGQPTRKGEGSQPEAPRRLGAPLSVKTLPCPGQAAGWAQVHANAPGVSPMPPPGWEPWRWCCQS